MLVFDASAMIDAWMNYPPDQFPGLWTWLGQQVKSREIRLPLAALQEVDHKLGECAEWLENHKHQRIVPTDEIVRRALLIKDLLQIEGDLYNPKGVDENDLFIIASAAVLKCALVSTEERQLSLPPTLAKYKIPAVCKLPKVKVTQLTFVEYLARSKHVFR